MRLLNRMLAAISAPFPGPGEAADCDECGRGIEPFAGARDEGRRKVWCSETCQAIGVERFAI